MINVTADDRELDWTYDYGLQDKLLELLNTSAFEGRLRSSIETDIKDTDNIDKEKYEKILFNLFSNQLDNVTHGNSYNMGDIKRHLRKLR